MVYSRAERVFIIEHNFATKSFAAVREAFSNPYPEKAAPNKTSIHQLVTKFRDRGSVTSVHRAIKQMKLRPYRFQEVHQLQQRDTAARIRYCHWFRSFVHERVHV
jgi:hypothetical protein